MMPLLPDKDTPASTWTPGRPADEDAETARIMASYPPELFVPDDMAVVLGEEDRDVAEKNTGLELLARARIETVPDGFSSSFLLAHIRDWKPQLKEWKGEKPSAVERDALRTVAKAANRLTLELERLKDLMNQTSSRISASDFAANWDHVRLDQLHGELDDLRNVALSQEVEETMKRADRPLKPKGGWSARVALYGQNIPDLYTRIFRRPFTGSGNPDIPPSEGVRFACVILTEILGYIVRPDTVVTQRKMYRRARSGKRGQK